MTAPDRVHAGPHGYAVDFGALTIPYPPGASLSVIMRGDTADTIAIRTGGGQLALNLYTAAADGTLPGYVGSCLRCFADENVTAADIDWISDTELAGATANGTVIHFAAVTGPRWLLRAATRAAAEHAAPHIDLAHRILGAATVRTPRHRQPGSVVELATEPTWIPVGRHS